MPPIAVRASVMNFATNATLSMMGPASGTFRASNKASQDFFVPSSEVCKSDNPPCKRGTEVVLKYTELSDETWMLSPSPSKKEVKVLPSSDTTQSEILCNVSSVSDRVEEIPDNRPLTASSTRGPNVSQISPPIFSRFFPILSIFGQVSIKKSRI